MKITGTTAFAGIIGCPIEHSLSPSIQNAAFEYVGLDCVYIPFNVHPDKLEIVFAGLAAAGCLGLNVTMPYKQAIYNLVDEVDDSASMIEAVNTVEFRGGRTIGHNTDGQGFICSLKRDALFDPAGKKALVIGAGGAAQSIVLSLAHAGVREIIILNRTAKKAELIVSRVGVHFEDCVVSVRDSVGQDEMRNCDLIVNATPVGMAANPGVPLSLDLIRSGQVVLDTIYWPAETELLRQAKGRGARSVNGAGMLLYQGAASFSIWTGRPAPIDEMEAVLRAELERKSREIRD